MSQLRKQLFIQLLNDAKIAPCCTLAIYHKRFLTGMIAYLLEYLGEASEQKPGLFPNIYAYFAENGQFYLVQEWIQGSTLGEILAKEGVKSETTVSEILLSLLPVLDYIHSKGDHPSGYQT